MTVYFILGGARSGKSQHAQLIAESLHSKRIYIATGQAFDTEMEERIRRHQQDRKEGWTTIEAPLDIASAITQNANSQSVLLVDCLTLWLSNLMHDQRDVLTETKLLVSSFKTAATDIILVSNEVGLGLVPDTPLGRAFRDEQGRLNQAIAAAANRVEFMAAGLPLVLKG